MDEALGAIAGAGVLSVGGVNESARRGGMMQLTQQTNRFRFAVNIDFVHRSGRHMSSKLPQTADAARGYVEPRRKP